MNWEKYNIKIEGGKQHGNVKCHCPECRDQRHDKRDRSLSVNLDTGMFHCHYCGWSGCAAERQEDYYAPFRNEQLMRTRQQEYRKPAKMAQTNYSDNLLAWFKGRGISEATLLKMKVAEGTEWMPQRKGEANTVQFNYFKDGELVNTKFRTGAKEFKLVPGAELLPYNLDAIKGVKECIITEGEMDALSFVECGFDNVVSVPNGANSNLSYLDPYLEGYFDDKETIYIASDTDSKGVALRDELLRRFGPERCRVLQYGDGCKDANEHLQKYGRESLAGCLKAAPEFKMDGVFQISDIEESLDSLFEHGMQKGKTLGYSNLDDLVSFETKRLCIVTGIPGHGKSEFIDMMAERLNLRYGWRFAYFSPENMPLEYHASKLIEKFTGKTFGRSTLGYGEYRQVKEYLEDNFFFIIPKDGFKLDAILERARYLVRRKGIKCLVIDPYNRLESEQGSRSETQYISMVLDKLTTFAQLNDVMVILMAHPTKLPKDTNGVTPVPTLYDISGSANFYNKADFGITVYRDRVNDVTRIHVQKVKFRHLGTCGEASFKYNLRNGRYVAYTGVAADGIVWDDSNHLQTELMKVEDDTPDMSGFFNENDSQLPY